MVDVTLTCPTIQPEKTHPFDGIYLYCPLFTPITDQYAVLTIVIISPRLLTTHTEYTLVY